MFCIRVCHTQTYLVFRLQFWANCHQRALLPYLPCPAAAMWIDSIPSIPAPCVCFCALCCAAGFLGGVVSSVMNWRHSQPASPAETIRLLQGEVEGLEHLKRMLGTEVVVRQS